MNERVSDGPLRVGIGGPRRMRGERPFVFTNLKTGHGLDKVIAFVEREGLLQ